MDLEDFCSIANVIEQMKAKVQRKRKHSVNIRGRSTPTPADFGNIDGTVLSHV